MTYTALYRWGYKITDSKELYRRCSFTDLPKLVHEQRDRIYMRKDIILKLSEYGTLNQSNLMAYCGLNNSKHKGILDELVSKGLIIKNEEPWGNKKIINYSVSAKGEKIAREILEPYESLFPRRNKQERAGNEK